MSETWLLPCDRMGWVGNHVQVRVSDYLGYYTTFPVLETSLVHLPADIQEGSWPPICGDWLVVVEVLGAPEPTYSQVRLPALLDREGLIIWVPKAHLRPSQNQQSQEGISSTPMYNLNATIELSPCTVNGVTERASESPVLRQVRTGLSDALLAIHGDSHGEHAKLTIDEAIDNKLKYTIKGEIGAEALQTLMTALRRAKFTECSSSQPKLLGSNP